MDKTNLIGLSSILVAVAGGVLWTTLNSNAQEAPKAPSVKAPAAKEMKGQWKHVELPERNTTCHNYRCPENPDGCGESHRTAAVEVSPLDGTIPLMFDMHANDLQYIVSKPGVATLPDDEFNAAQFNPKQDGFERGQKLQERITYPTFKRNEQAVHD